MNENITVSNEQLKEVLKALGFGNITTDVAQLTQGQALVAQSLDTVVKEMTYGSNSFPYLDALPTEQVDNELHEWTDMTDIGGEIGDTRSDRFGATAENNSTYNRRTTRVRYYTAAGGVYQTLTAQPGAFPQVNNEDISAMKRIKRDESVDVWSGNNLVSPEQMDGYSSILDQFGNYDGDHIADLMGNGYSGVDANGWSNPADLKVAATNLGKVVNRPFNGSGFLPDAYMSPDVYSDVNRVFDFTPYQILNGGPQGLVTGALVDGWANRYGGPSQMTKVNQDQYILDGERLKPAEARNAVTTNNPPAAPASVTTGTGTAADSRFSAAWNGTYRYWVASLDKYGRESLTTAPAAAVTADSSTANAITLTIAPSAGGLETGYAIYRGQRNGANDIQNSRLMAKVAKASGGGNTTFVDKNLQLPGAQNVYFINTLDADARGKIIYTLPFSKIEIPRSLSGIFKVPFAIGKSSALVVGKPRHLAKVINYIAKGDGTWSPL